MQGKLRDPGFEQHTVLQRTCHATSGLGYTATSLMAAEICFQRVFSPVPCCPARIRGVSSPEMARSDLILDQRRVASPPASEPHTRAEALATAARALRAAEHVCILTGAGVSAESGIATFREAQTGLWARFSPQELATPEAFASSPDRVWQWYAARRMAVRQAQPNAAHLALVTLASRVSHCTLVTQNVDDLHQRAGSRDVVPLHGSLMRVRCSAGCAGVVEPADGAEAAAPDAKAPVCDRCGARMRPDVVWFGESLPAAPFETARAAAVACDLFLSVGTSNVVAPAAGLPWLAASHGATVIVVNPTMEGQRRGPSILPLEGPAGVMLPRLVEAAFAGKRARQRDPQAGQ